MESKKLLPAPAARVASQRRDVWSVINDAAAQSPFEHVVNMGQGFFGYNPPEFLIEAAQEAVTRVDANQYSPSKGRPRLRSAIAKVYGPSLGRKIDPETEVGITTGANEGILSAFMAFVQEGDEVIVFEPFFDQYISNIEMAGGKVRYVALSPPASGDKETGSSADWLMDMAALKSAVNPRTRMIVINSPHNPIGKIFSREELTAVADICVANNIIMLSDEVYDSLYYVDDIPRLASLSPDAWDLTITVGSAGKTFYATGWRVGYLVGPEHLIKYASAAHMRICYSSPSPLQEACAVAFERAEGSGFWKQSRLEMQSKIRRFTAVCDELGLPYTNPQGGYFVLVNFSRLRLPEDYVFPEHVVHRARDFKLAWFLIVEVGLAAIPPSEFYLPQNQGVAENYLRFAICKDDEVLEEAKERLRKLKKYLQ